MAAADNTVGAVEHPWEQDVGKANCLEVRGESESHSVVSDSLQPHGLYSSWNSPGQNTGVGIAFPFSRGSSQTRDRTQVSCIVGGFFTS